MTGTTFSLEVRPTIPKALSRLTDLASNLLYSWDRGIRHLFSTLDPELWEATGHNPRLFLRRVDQDRLNQAAGDPLYLRHYVSCVSSFDTYLEHRHSETVTNNLDKNHDLVAYFCAEYGVHESLPIYSGGLGILAGDHCKEASDLGLPFVGVGLLYRHGYFQQQIDGNGRQHAQYADLNFNELPVFPVADKSGQDLQLTVRLEDRDVAFKVWEAKVGIISIYLLDTDLEQNGESDRFITHQLYGGGTDTRIQQEILLGIGGVKALRAMDIQPTVWHINEGHAALLILERCRELVSRNVLFEAAFEMIAAATVFTTHTPVPAGHDIFPRDLIDRYLGDFLDDLKVDADRLLELGHSPGHEGSFNMTALALRGSRFRNGVSRLHGEVSSKLSSFVWPQIDPDENPIGHVTNGVHVLSFIHHEWVRIFDQHLSGEWRDRLVDRDFWAAIMSIPDRAFWATHQTIKALLMEEAKQRITQQGRRNGLSQSQITRLTRCLNPETLVIGFARRFATYKRATLLTKDMDRLTRLVKNNEHPVVFIFAGKAHPQDGPGQEYLHAIYQLSRHPDFEGRIVLLEAYDIELARFLVTGVDIWFNTPEYPMEASGTSGQKAAINGIPHFSVLDGWWAEGFEGDNGWAISPYLAAADKSERDYIEASGAFDLLEGEIVPLYYKRDGQGYSSDWVQVAKQAMISALSRFSAQRMLTDYITQYYSPAAKLGQKFCADDSTWAKELVAWKRRIQKSWHGVKIRRSEMPAEGIRVGDEAKLVVHVMLNGLQPDDLRVECLISDKAKADRLMEPRQYPLSATGITKDGWQIYEGEIGLSRCGRYSFKLRAYPHHHSLSHRLEMGHMVWL